MIRFNQRHRMLPLLFLMLLVGTDTVLAKSLAEQANEPGEVETLTSTKSDPIGVDGLPGLVGSFIVAASCDEAHWVISEIEKYPERVEKVKEVVVLKREPSSLTVRYTEGAMGISSTSTMRWTFTGAPERSVSSIVVGEGESPSYTMIRFLETKDPGYCQLLATVFADVSWLPRFAVSWVMDATREELASAYREMIRRGQVSAK